MNFIKKILLASEIFLKLSASRLDTAKSKYPNLEDQIDILSKSVPNTNDKYLMWMSRELDKGNDIDDIINYVKLFDKFNKRLKKRDIHQYSSIDELKSVLDNTDLESKTKQRQNMKESGAVKLYEDNEFLLYRIDSKAACDLYGGNTKWCITSGKGHKHYYTYFDYTFVNTAFYFLIRKNAVNDSYDKIAFVFGPPDSAILPEYSTPIKLIEIRDADDEEIDFDDVVTHLGAEIAHKIEIVIRNDIKNNTLTKEQFEELKESAFDGRIDVSDIEKIVLKYPGDKGKFIANLDNKFLFQLLQSKHEKLSDYAFSVLYERQVGIDILIKYIDVNNITTWKDFNKEIVYKYLYENNLIFDKINEYTVADIVDYYPGDKEDLIRSLDEKYYSIWINKVIDKTNENNEIFFL